MLSDFTDDAAKMADKRAAQTYVARKLHGRLRSAENGITVTVTGRFDLGRSSILMAICSTEQLIWAGVLWHVVKILILWMAICPCS